MIPFISRWLDPTLMSRSDAARWAAARTFGDLCELTAQWIEGTIGSQPGYCGPSDIEDPAMVPVLAALNRAGFLTSGSQAGCKGDGWEQRAAAEGFIAGTAAAYGLADAAWKAGMTVVMHSPDTLPTRRYRCGGAVTVTRSGGGDYTEFGVQVPRRHIRSRITGYGICRRSAVRELCEAWQVTVIDPEWGRRDLLWPALMNFANDRRAAA